jgi:serine/threonine protein phosphatase PrpC
MIPVPPPPADKTGPGRSGTPSVPPLAAFAQSRQGPQGLNCDSFYLDTENGVFAVADGMGKGAEGREAGRIAIAAFLEALGGPPGISGEEEINKLLIGAIAFAHARISEWKSRTASAQRSGSTLTAAVLRGGKVHVAHVGDSRAYQVRAGRARPITADHSVTGELLRSFRISSLEAKSHPMRGMLVRCLGTGAPEADIHCLQWLPDDVLILCSDGAAALLEGTAFPGPQFGLLQGAEGFHASLETALDHASLEDDATWIAVGWPAIHTIPKPEDA